MDKLPALVKARAMGGARPRSSSQDGAQDAVGADGARRHVRPAAQGCSRAWSPASTSCSRNVERRNALAAATPSIWPAHGWLSSTMGPRRDPITGGADYHSGLDIAGERGQPVYATAVGHGQTASATRAPTATCHRSITASVSRRGTATFSSSRSSRARRSSAATSSGRSAPPAAPPAITSTTRCSPTAGSSTRSSCSRSKPRDR